MAFKNTLFILFTCIGLHHLSAQTTNVWYDDLEVASKVAYKSDKPIMLFFTGSDWCGWCIRLQKEVFQQEAFKQWAADNVILVELDFPSKKSASRQDKRTKPDATTTIRSTWISNVLVCFRCKKRRSIQFK